MYMFRAGGNIPRLAHFESLAGSFPQCSSRSSKLVYMYMLVCLCASLL